jgi:hypothetical protein
VCGAKQTERIHVLVLLLYDREHQRRQCPAEDPPRVRDNAGNYCFRQRPTQLFLPQTFIDSTNAGVTLAGIKLTCDYRLSCLHFSHLLLAFAISGGYYYGINSETTDYCKRFVEKNKWRLKRKARLQW